MAALARGLADGAISPESLPDDVQEFLETIGFLDPDPPTPQLPEPQDTIGMVTLLLTTRCNLRCIYCYANGGEEPIADVPLEVARQAIDHACEGAAGEGQPDFQLCFHGGGEPVQAWGLLQAVTAYARSRPLPCHISLVSNGVWSPAQREWLLEQVDDFSISFDGGPETQNRQRPFPAGAGSFDLVMETIRALDRRKSAYGIRMTALEPWSTHLPEDVRFVCEETDCPGMQVEPAFTAGRGQHSGPSRSQADDFIAGFMAAWEIANAHGRRLEYSGARPANITASFCSAPNGGLIVHPQGRLVACYEVANDSHPLLDLSTIGHIDGQGISMDEGSRRRLLDGIEARRERCRDCFCFWHCAGDCYTRAYASDGGAEAFPGQSPRCHINREITKQMLLWYMMAGDGVWQGQQPSPQELRLLSSF